jgi:transposase
MRTLRFRASDTSRRAQLFGVSFSSVKRVTLVLCDTCYDCSGIEWVCLFIMKKKYPVILSDTERDNLKSLIAAGTAPARKLTHARILLKADQSQQGPGWVDERVADAVEVSQPTVCRVRKQYFEEGLEAALNRRPPNREYHRKLDGEQEARLIALACSEPPEGQARWSLRLLADRMVELSVVEDISYQTVRRTLKKTSLSPT